MSARFCRVCDDAGGSTASKISPDMPAIVVNRGCGDACGPIALSEEEAEKLWSAKKLERGSERDYENDGADVLPYIGLSVSSPI